MLKHSIVCNHECSACVKHNKHFMLMTTIDQEYLNIFHKIDDIIRVQNYSCNDSDIDPMWMKEAEEISDG